MPDTPRPADGRRVLVTGAAGFIGYHLADLLLEEGFAVHGFDAMTDYYDVALKRARLERLARHGAFGMTEARLEDEGRLAEVAATFRPHAVVHLAAQAGVRYSLENPHAYVDANVLGSFAAMQAATEAGAAHLLMASSSSVYGANARMPLAEAHAADHPLTIYAATKKASEAMSHAWAHVHGIPTTVFRFFTVYGPWGRPDMAYFKFADAIAAGRPIDVYGHGRMQRDFTYVGDLVRAIRLLLDVPPPPPGQRGAPVPGDSLSPAAPWRVVNIGNSERVALTDFIDALEAALGMRAERRLMPMQTGEVPATWADAGLLRALTGHAPATDHREGLRRFAAWWKDWRGL